MILRLGDVGGGVKNLQRGLNRLGSLLLVDGQFGTGTRDAVVDARTSLGMPGSADADDTFQEALDAIGDPFPALTSAGVTFIGRCEVAGPSEYRQRYAKPCWPGAISGITIGIGYDLQFVSEQQFRTDWGDRLPPDALDRLATVTAVVGSAARLAQVRDVSIPLTTAVAVLMSRTLPRFIELTRGIYPRVDTVSPPRCTALVSLVYNRGPRLEDRDPIKEDRREMRTIRDLLASGDVDAVADQFDAMTRLWNSQQLSGLVKRRRDEATLWRSGFSALQLE